MTIKSRLFLGFISQAVLVGAVGLVAVAAIGVTERGLREMRRRTLPEVYAANDLAGNLLRLNSLVHRFVDSDPDQRLEQASIIDGAMESTLGVIGRWRNLIADEIREKPADRTEPETQDLAALATLQERVEQLRSYWQDDMNAPSATDASHQAAHEQLDILGRSMLDLALGLQKRTFRQIEQSGEEALHASDTGRKLIAIFAVIAFGVALVAGTASGRPPSLRLRLMREQAAALGGGKLETRMTDTGRDEIGDLARTFNQMADSLKTMREELVAKASVEAADKAKSEFLATLSHELRTPMSVIMGYSEMMLDAHQDPQQRHECVNVIRRSASHLLDLINDILDVSKIEAGKMTVEKIACPLPSLLVDVVSLMRPRATEKGLTLSVAVDSPIPASITTDPLRVRQVLLNLLSNAVKFTERGSVTLHIACTRTDAGDTLAFKVVDTGIGMTEQQMQRLFQPFMQADKSTTRRFGGTGLGLAITRRLVQLLGGEIHVHSQPGVGTTFELTIDGGCTASPLVHEINATLDDGQATPCLHLMGDVLLAEDSPPLQSLIAAYLRKAGLHVEVADHGAQAVELATTRVFDVILMDMQMPVMDGYTAASTLRERGINTPIIALTANAMAEDRQRCLRAGCTDYLSKPIDRTKLLACLAEHLEPLTEPRPITSTCRDPEMQQLITDYINDLPRYVAELSEAVQQRDLATLRRRLHTLKGTGGTFGLDPITHTAEHAESIVQPGAQLEAIQHAVDDMIEMLRSVEGYDRRKESVQGCVSRSGGL